MLFVIVFLVAALIYSFFLLESLIKAEHDLDKVAWEADGKPRGFFWSSPECTWLGSSLAFKRVSFAWLFKTPAWAAKSVSCCAQLKHLRIAVLIWNIGIAACFIHYFSQR